MHGIATDSTLAVPPPLAPVRRAGGLALVVPAILLLTAAAVGWYVFGPSRPPTPSAAVAPSEPTPTAPAVAAAPAVGSPADPATQPPPLSAALPGAPTIPGRETPSTAGPAPRASRSAVAAAPPQAASPPEIDRSASVPPPDTPAPAPPAVPAEVPRAATSAPATAVFKGLILMDRIDDEDEELDVSVRLDGRRVVVLDEDGIAKRSIGYDSIARATYNSRKPGRFSLRRGPSHWLTLEVGTTPIVLRLNGRTYEQVLTALQGHGVRVERNP